MFEKIYYLIDFISIVLNTFKVLSITVLFRQATVSKYTVKGTKSVSHLNLCRLCEVQTQVVVHLYLLPLCLLEEKESVPTQEELIDSTIKWIKHHNPAVKDPLVRMRKDTLNFLNYQATNIKSDTTQSD